MLVVPLFNINKETYRNISKFFTKINNKFLIEFCLESLNITKEEEILFIINFYDCNNLNLNKILKKIYKNCIINIIKKSNSILDTLYQSKELIKDDEKLIIFAPPFTYFKPVFDFNTLNKEECFVLLFKSNNPNHCYVEIKNENIINIKEKEIIGNHALLGLYAFKNKKIIFDHLSEDIVKNKFYLSDILNCILENNQKIYFNKSELFILLKILNILIILKSIEKYSSNRNLLIIQGLTVKIK